MVFLINSAYVCIATLSNNWYAYQPFVMDAALLSIIAAGLGQLVKMSITLELDGIFGPNFA